MQDKHMMHACSILNGLDITVQQSARYHNVRCH